MSLEMLAYNIRRLRVGRRLSQSKLAALAGLSLPAIKNIEGAKKEPRVGTVQRIAQALDVRLLELFSPTRTLNTVRFRSSKRMQNRENILAEIMRRLEDFLFLEGILNEREEYAFHAASRVFTAASPVEAAEKCRRSLGLESSETIRDICGLLESAGIKVLSLPLASEGFFGLSVGEADGGPAIVVNVWERISVERRIFSAAHELGHLVLHPRAYDVGQVEEDAQEEREADLFGGHFLMPQAAFCREWGDASGLHWVDRVLKIKGIFNVSYKTVLARLVEEGLADSSIWVKFHVSFEQRYHKRIAFREEPTEPAHAEPHGLPLFRFQEDRFNRLVRRAIEEDKISHSRGAEMLGISIEDMHELLNDWEDGR